MQRITKLVDENSFMEIGSLVTARNTDFNLADTRTRDSKTQSETNVPRTARARATAAPPTTRPVALTPWQDKRRLWQEKRTTLRLRHNDRAKKGTPRHSISYPFPFFLFLSLATGTGKGGYLEKDPSP